MKPEQPNASQQSPRPNWHFPPTGGGIEVIQESATTNFRESPLDKFVREVLQNSTDAHDHNADPVEVTFQEAFYPSELFGADSLTKHTEAARLAASEENQPKLEDQYRKAAETLRQPTIRCLNIADRNTTGLSGPKWDALLTKAGAIKKDQTTAGGRFGIGKNAVFNISAAKTAFYYTCFQDGVGRKRHRVEKWMGKSILTAHTIDGETKQHIGFYRHNDGQPMEGSTIPEPIRMKTAPGQPNTSPNGTIITVLGFDPQSAEWPQEIAKSATANFFYAIHRGQLIVTVMDINGDETRIDRNTMKNIFAKHDRDPNPEDQFSRAHSYYKSISVQRDTTDVILPGPIDGTVEARLILNDGPSRSAYINWNGMFVTDSREVHKNPFQIRTPQYCPDYAIIITPKDDRTNEFIRDLENVAHDEVQQNSIEDPDQKIRVKQSFLNGRRQLIELVNARIERDLTSGNRNLHQLAGIVGDETGSEIDEAGQPRKLTTRTRKQNFQTASALAATETQTPDSPQPPPGPTLDPSPDPKPDPSSDPKPDPSPGPPKQTPTRASAIGRVRLIAAGPHDAAILFTTTRPDQTIKLRLTPSGEMASNEAALQITSASEDQSATIVVNGETIEIQARQARRYYVRISTADNISKTALSIRNIA